MGGHDDITTVALFGGGGCYGGGCSYNISGATSAKNTAFTRFYLAGAAVQ